MLKVNKKRLSAFLLCVFLFPAVVFLTGCELSEPDNEKKTLEKLTYDNYNGHQYHVYKDGFLIGNMSGHVRTTFRGNREGSHMIYLESFPMGVSWVNSWNHVFSDGEQYMTYLDKFQTGAYCDTANEIIVDF
jgi:hypothetical protein